jgi:hypothetical protein
LRRAPRGHRSSARGPSSPRTPTDLPAEPSEPGRSRVGAAAYTNVLVARSHQLAIRHKCERFTTSTSRLRSGRVPGTATSEQYAPARVGRSRSACRDISWLSSRPCASAVLGQTLAMTRERRSGARADRLVLRVQRDHGRSFDRLLAQSRRQQMMSSLTHEQIAQAHSRRACPLT